MRIAELAADVGVPISTVRYYERIGLMPEPQRTGSGYRDYDGAAVARLLLIHRARRMGLTCEQVADLLPAWDWNDCPTAHARVTQLIEAKQAELAARIAELSALVAQLDAARAELEASPPPATCRADLSCCAPEGPEAGPVPVGFLAPASTARRHWPG